MKQNQLKFLVLVAAFAALVSPISVEAAEGKAAGVDFVTGGVGFESRQQMLAQAKEYNPHIEFTIAPAGNYVADVEVNIADSKGNNVLSTRTDGPWLFARLPAGNYTVTARYGNSVQRQQVSVGGAGTRRLTVRFPATAEPVAAGS